MTHNLGPPPAPPFPPTPLTMDLVVLVLPVLDGRHVERRPVGENEAVGGLGGDTGWGGHQHGQRGPQNLVGGAESSLWGVGRVLGGLSGPSGHLLWVWMRVTDTEIWGGGLGDRAGGWRKFWGVPQNPQTLVCVE